MHDYMPEKVGDAIEAESPRWVAGNVDRLVAVTDEIEKRLEALISRLEPVLGPTSPQLAESTTGDRRPISPLATRLDGVCERLTAIALRQESLMGRIEV